MHGTVPFALDKTRPARIGLMSRSALATPNSMVADVQWFEIPPTMIFHTVAAWEEGSVVKLYACSMNAVSAKT